MIHTALSQASKYMLNDELREQIILLLLSNLIPDLSQFWTIAFLIVLLAPQANRNKNYLKKSFVIVSHFYFLRYLFFRPAKLLTDFSKNVSKRVVFVTSSTLSENTFKSLEFCLKTVSRNL